MTQRKIDQIGVDRLDGWVQGGYSDFGGTLTRGQPQQLADGYAAASNPNTGQ